MADKFQIPRGIGIQPPQRIDHQTPKTKGSSPNRAAFQDVFQQELDKSAVKFSAHAEKRLAVKGITLSREQLSALEGAVDKAAKKGGKESLILMGDLAFVVSVKNRTVITAIDGERMRDNVFTQIDSAVIT